MGAVFSPTPVVQPVVPSAEALARQIAADAALAVDGNPETCSVTKADSKRWWSVQLPKAVNVQEVSVVLNQGLAFHQEFTVFVIGENFVYSLLP